MNDKITEIKNTHADSTPMRYDNLAINAYEYITYLLQLVETQQFPIAVGDDVTNGGWKLDYRFLREIERRISESEFREERPSMEQIELSLLFAQELLKESI